MHRVGETKNQRKMENMNKDSIKTLIQITKLTGRIKKKYILLLALSNLILVLLSLGSVLNTQNIINNVQLGIRFTEWGFLIPLLLYPLIMLLSEGMTMLNQYFSSVYSDEVNYKFSTMLLEVIKKQELEQFENPKFYDLIQRAERAAGIYPFKIMMSLLSLSMQIMTSIGFIMILINWRWWSLLLLVIFPLLSATHLAKIAKNEYQVLYNRTKFERASWYFAHLLNKDLFIKETKLFSLEDYFLGRFKAIREKFLHENEKMYRKRTLATFIIQSLSILSTAAIIFMLFLDASNGVILIGSLVALISSISNTKDAIKKIFTVCQQLHQDSLYANDILSILNFKGANLNEASQENLRSIEKFDVIRLENVSFKYPSNLKYALENINVTFENGRKYMIAGKNGSGKSTLAKLVLGFYESYEGRITIDGVDLREINIQSYRKCLSAVFQDFTKYQLTLKESVTVSNRSQENDIEKIKDSLAFASVDFISKLSDGYNQQLGNWFEGGKQLSGGEWQKLSIARAFFRDVASLVVLDEPSSALDPISEYAVYQSFQKLSLNKIGLLITHRLKNYEFDGEILFLEEGKITEQGTREELWQLNGNFKAMCDIQNIIGSKNDE